MCLLIFWLPYMGQLIISTQARLSTADSFHRSLRCIEWAASFGVTCHEMAAAVDSGPIIVVDRFAIPDGANREALDTLTYRALIGLVEKLAPRLVDISPPLAHSADIWSGPVRTRADFNALFSLPPNVAEDEFHRRYRAIGEGPNHALSIELLGQRFKLDNQRDAPVVGGGREIN